MTSSNLTLRIALPLVAYLLGSIPWGIVLAPFFTTRDIRRQGSGNIGATNVLRIAGLRAGALVLAADLLKGALPVFVASLLVNPAGGPGQAYEMLVALAAFGGHLFPLYLGLKNGGKGVATAFGCILIIAPFAALVCTLIFVLMVCISGRASVGSLSGSAALPFVMWKATGSWLLTLGAGIMAVCIVARHSGNIRRLLKGTESRIF